MGCFPPTSDPPQGILATSPTATQYKGSLAHRLGVWLSASAVGSPTALLGASKVRPSNPHPCLCTTEGMSLGDSGGQLHIGRRQLSLKVDFLSLCRSPETNLPKAVLLPAPCSCDKGPPARSARTSNCAETSLLKVRESKNTSMVRLFVSI